MTKAAANSLKDHPAFAGLSKATLEQIQKESNLLDCQPGQPLSLNNQIPNQVLLILSGQARLLVTHNQRTQTLEKIGPGALVGLVSLVRAAGCEYVTASSHVKALALPDSTILQLLQNENSFRKYCQETIWSAELFELIAHKFRKWSGGGITERTI